MEIFEDQNRQNDDKSSDLAVMLTEFCESCRNHHKQISIIFSLTLNFILF